MKKNEKDRLIFLGYIAVVIASFLLGLFPTVTKPVISSVSPLFFSSIVGVAPFIIFTPVLVSTSRRTPKVKVEEQRPLARNTQRAIFGIVLISSFIGGIAGPIFYFFGLQGTTAADASLLANAEMVFTIIIATFAFHEKLNRVGLVAVLLVALGVIVVATNLQFSGSTLDFLAPGHILILMSSLCWGIDNNLITYASERIDVVKFVVYRSSIVGPVLLLLSYLSSTFPPNASELGKIFLIGLVIFGGAMYTNFLALKWLGAIRSTLIFPISSLFGLVAAYLILHEEIGFYQIVSVGIIFIGIYLMTRTESVRREYSYDLP
jgi:drug/metabolite transporter (DMT)-like permease